MCDCLRSLPAFDFKWAAIEQKLITSDDVVVFNVLKSLGHCVKEKLQQQTQLTARRLDKALNRLIVLEKVVRKNGELIFVPLPPELEALVAAQAHATTDEEVEALCAAPAVTDATSTKPCAPAADPEPCSDTKSESHVEAASQDSAAQDKASATSSDTVESSPVPHATSDNVVAVTQDKPQAVPEPAPAPASSAPVENAASRASQTTTAVTEAQATPVEQSSAATASNAVFSSESVVNDIPVLQAEPIEPQASFAGQSAVNGQPVNMVFAAQSSQNQAMAYMANAQNAQGSVAMPPYQSSIAANTNAPAQLSAAMPFNQGFASVPAFAPAAMPQQPQFVMQSVPYMPANGNYNPVGTKILGDHPRDLQEVVNYIYSLDPLEYAHILCDRSVDIDATATKFYNYYAARDWFIGDAPISNWTYPLKSAIAPGVCASTGKKNGWAIVKVDLSDEIKKRKTRAAMANQAQQAYTSAGNKSAATPAQASGSAANGGDESDKKYDRLVLPSEWRNMDNTRQARLRAKLIELIGHSPKREDFSATRSGVLSLAETKAYRQAKREYNKKALENVASLLDQYRNVPTDQI